MHTARGKTQTGLGRVLTIWLALKTAAISVQGLQVRQMLLNAIEKFGTGMPRGIKACILGERLTT